MTKIGQRQRCMSALALGAMFVTAVIGTPAATAQTYRVLLTFTGTNGEQPVGDLIRDSAGNLYGTASKGGILSGCEFIGCGVVFKLDTSGTETVLYSFTGGADGASPRAGLIRDSAGNLYGTTYGGGTSNSGVVFKLDTSGTETVLYSFTSADGRFPYAGPIRDAAGNLYGTTQQGGASTASAGVVFKLDTSGTETVLYSFTGGADGDGPDAGLIRDSAGNFYGTTQYGGASDHGVVFTLDASGTERVLHSFTGADGAQPEAGLVRDLAGNLYGTTMGGGASGAGVVFKLDTSGRETVLYSFTGGSDGKQPRSGLIRDSAGNFYGTTAVGGASGEGVVFKLDTSGTETVLYAFPTGGPDGSHPKAGVILDSAGNFYGTAQIGGRGHQGVVFKLQP